MNQMSLKEMVKRLVEHYKTPAGVAAVLDGRASARTVYRWHTGTTVTRNAETLRRLRELVDQVDKDKGTPTTSG